MPVRDPRQNGSPEPATGKSRAGEGKAVGITDVAAAAGVSLGTVSNVLNWPERVSPRTRDKVIAAMTELNFVRNESARQLRAGRSRIFAYVMLDGSNPFFTDVAAGIEDAAEGSDLSLFMCSSANRPDRERGYLSKLEEQRVQGILVTPVDPEATIFAEIAERGTPVIMVDRTPATGTFCSVAVDDVFGGEIALQHLLERGHERIAFVGGPTRLGQVRDRRDGALRALSEADRAPANLVDLTTSSLTVADGRNAGERLAGLPSSQRPTAAFCANDLLALGLLQTCVALGLRVPEDLAIVGYDDIEFAAAAAVPLTSVRQPRRELGRTATKLLLQEAADSNHEHQQVMFTPELVVRASSSDGP